MKVTTVNQSISDFTASAIIVNLFEGVKEPGGATAAVDKALDGLLTKVIEQESFEGKLGQTLVVHTNGNIPADRVIVVGLGPAETLTLEKIRRASTAAARKAKESKSRTVATIVHGSGSGSVEPVYAAQATVEGAVIGTYEFNKYKSKPGDAGIEELFVIEFDAEKTEIISSGVEHGIVVSEAVNTARDLINSPANEINPTYLADYAEEIAAKHHLKLEILEREDCEKLGMGSFIGVTLGSSEPPKFIVMRYEPNPKPDKTIAIIGKGITFDTGGYSIKPADSMFGMKDDMSGAAAVLCAMDAIAELKPDINVLMLVAATENMISGSAYRPGDILTAMNGKTIEVENTDAEGRLTLADALCYAVREGANEIIDLATLTGACVVAIGRRLSGLFCNNEEFQERLMIAGDTSGDALWPMPMLEDYFEQIESKVADMKNTGGREAGATTAALLLKEFVDEVPWAHIDIAGPAFMNKDNGLVAHGGTGAGVRLLIEYICSQQG